MSKRNFPTRMDPINLPRRLREGLEEAEYLLEQDKPQEALNRLTELDRHFPRQPDVLGMMGNAHLEIGNGHGYLHSIYRLHELLPNRADVKVGLAGAYLSNGYLALAIQTFSQFLKRWPQDERASDIQKTIPELEELLKDFSSNQAIPWKQVLSFLLKKQPGYNSRSFLIAAQLKSLGLLTVFA